MLSGDFLGFARGPFKDPRLAAASLWCLVLVACEVFFCFFPIWFVTYLRAKYFLCLFLLGLVVEVIFVERIHVCAYTECVDFSKLNLHNI